MKKRMLIIVNPCSGTKQGMKRLGEIVSILQDGGYICTTVMTDRRGAATDIVREDSGVFDAVTCVGGDGTFNEVVNGLLLAGSELPIGYIPTGSTNDFANSLHLSSDVADAAKDIANGATRLLDIGCFGTRCFSYVASFGAFTKASYDTPQSVKNSLGHLAYVLSGAMETLNLRSQHMRFETAEGVYEDDYIFGAISNSTSLGGVLTIDPKQVDMSDGLLEMMLIKMPRNISDFIKITNALSRKSYNCSMIDFVSTSRVTFCSDKPTDWSVDGEKETAEGSVDIVNRHNALRLFVRQSEEEQEKVLAEGAMRSDTLSDKRRMISRLASGLKML